MRRFYEAVPGILAWLTLVLMFVLSRFLPVWVSIFIILFDTYWLLKTIYLSFHLRATFAEMRGNMKVNWLERISPHLKNISSRDIGQTGSGARSKDPDTASSSGLAGQHAERERGGAIFEMGASKLPDLYHLIILPMYNEPYEVVRESFESLVHANYPKEKFIVVLALEERGGDAARRTGELIEKEYGNKFYKFLVTVHPAGLPGEIPGKGSNEAWAAARAKEAVIDPLRIDHGNILVSVFDIDTQVLPEYFGRLVYVFLNTKDPLRAIYQPIPLFVNNIYEAPALARVVSFSCTFWQMMQQSRPERLTSFSSQSIPFQALDDIGFWQKDIVSEDSRIFWQGYFAYHGDFRVEPLFFPVCMDAPVAPTFWGTMKNIYKQQRRWAWGAENVPYLLEGFAQDKTIPKRKRWYWTFNAIEGYHSWATNSLIIFALGWLPLFLGGAHFNTSFLSYSLPHITRLIVSLSMIGVASSAILSILLLPPREGGQRPADYLVYFLQWLFMPLTLIIFGAIPGIEAQTRLMLGGKYKLGFWVTPKTRKKI